MPTIEGLISEVWSEREQTSPIDPVRLKRAQLSMAVVRILNEGMNSGLVAFPGETPIRILDLARSVEPENEEKVRALVREAIARNERL